MELLLGAVSVADLTEMVALAEPRNLMLGQLDQVFEGVVGAGLVVQVVRQLVALGQHLQFQEHPKHTVVVVADQVMV
jgi:hypothetical protein